MSAPAAQRSPRPAGRRIGVDFDNTIIGYDDVFAAAARAAGLIGAAFAGGKQAVRDAVRLLPDGELAWQRLQGRVYGKDIEAAVALPGFAAFLRRCREAGDTVFVVSHKTQYGHFDPDRVNLREAALGWMRRRGFFAADGHGLRLEDVYFESTRAEKLRRIAALRCTHFIDDLAEVLDDPDFPPDVERILFSPDRAASALPYGRCPSWRAVEQALFDADG